VTVWIIAGLSLLAIGEAIVVVLLLMQPRVVVLPPRAEGSLFLPPAELLSGDTGAAAQALASVGAGQPGPVSTPTTPAAPPAAVKPVVPVPAGPRFGGLTVSSPIELQVFKDGALLGSTAGPIAVGEGRFTLEFVNQALGFRVPQVVTIGGGQMTSLKVPVPNGRLSINAVPWADVTIDGVAAGQTPLANLALPIGTHEVVFGILIWASGGRRWSSKLTSARVTQSFRETC
jgi:hypothetical protein